jgi:hypothetical protein
MSTPQPQPASPAASTVEHIIATAAGEPVADGPNRRASSRFPLKGSLTLFETDLRGHPTAELSCSSGDISRSGIGFRSRRMLYANRNVFLIVPTPSGKRVLYGVVRQCRYIEGHHCYHIGVSLLEMPADDTIRSWAASIENS